MCSFPSHSLSFYLYSCSRRSLASNLFVICYPPIMKSGSSAAPRPPRPSAESSTLKIYKWSPVHYHETRNPTKLPRKMTTPNRSRDPLPGHPFGLEIFNQSDNYHASFLIKPDEDLDGASARQQQAGLPDIAVSPSQGKLLYLLAKTANAKRILEVGTLAGYAPIGLVRNVSQRSTGTLRSGYPRQSQKTVRSSPWN